MASTPLIDADELLGVPKPASSSRHTCYMFDGAYWTAVFTIVNAALGAGILAYPSAVSFRARAPLRARALRTHRAPPPPLRLRRAPPPPLRLRRGRSSLAPLVSS